MKKAFTLLELLAVIAILGILVVLAVPKVTDIIETAKIKTYKSNEEVVIKSAKNYLTFNEELLPKEIGETTEITFEQLQNEKYMNQITDSDGICNGYILVTKTEEDYEYIPHVKCGGSNTISSSTEDGLIAHYTFDDFQEPTQNLLYNNPMIMDNYGETIHGIEEGTRYFIKSSNYDNYWYAGIRIPYIAIEPGEKYTFSIELKNKETDFYINYDFNVNGGNYVGNDSGRNYNYKEPSYYTNVNSWEKLITTSSTYDDIISPKLSDAFCPIDTKILDKKIYYKNEQLEKKSYSTPFTENIRKGEIKDYSGNGKNIILNLETTPRWLENNNNGYYEFDGENDYLDLSDLELYNPNNYNGGATVSMWIKSMKNDNPFAGFIAGFHYWAIIEDGRLRNMISKTEEGINYWLYSKSKIELDKWVNITYIIKEGESVSYYINGELDALHESNTIDIHNYSSNSTIGADYAKTFNGSIDDVKIYNRALSEEEIKYDYEMNKYKYE